MTPKDPPTRSGRILALDGWRGIAIFLVLFDHILIDLVRGHRWALTYTSEHGVTIFFVLSGFLITSKLLERDTSLKSFYIRRFFRLMPAAWTFLAALLIMNYFSGIQFTTLKEVRSCLLFYRNFVGSSVGGEGVAGHFWSLSLEEQFYLFWPAIFLLSGIRRARWIAACGAIACAVYRYANWAQYDFFAKAIQTQVRADALLVGCLVALLLVDPHFASIARKWTPALTLPALVALIYGIYRFHALPPLFECVAIGVLIAATVLHPGSIFVRALSVRPLVWLGVVSYSVYIWQELFVRIGLTVPEKLAALCVMPIFALGSYYWIERPCTRLGHRLTSKRSSQSPAAVNAGSSVPATSSPASSPEMS